MTSRLPWLYHLLGAYFLAVGCAGLLGLAAAVVTAFRDLTLLDICLSTIAFLLPLLAGLALWRRSRAAWPLAFATLVPQILEIATGRRLFRLVLGVYWKVALQGTPPETGLGFAVGVSNPAAQPEMGRWVSLNVVALALTLALVVAVRRSRDRPNSP